NRLGQTFSLNHSKRQIRSPVKLEVFPPPGAVTAELTDSDALVRRERYFHHVSGREEHRRAVGLLVRQEEPRAEVVTTPQVGNRDLPARLKVEPQHGENRLSYIQEN